MDHSTVVDELGVVHCFWTRGGNWIAGEGVDFGHAASADLRDWTNLGRVQLTSPQGRIDGMWAPHVVRLDDVWQMYFTGVELAQSPAQNIQRIYVSESPDLMHWSEARMVLEPGGSDIAWGSGMDWANDCRDPMVFYEGGGLKMLVTVRLLNGRQSLALAERRENAEWEVVGVLESIQGDVVESPFLYQDGGRFYLLINSWGDGGQSVWRSDRIRGDWRRISHSLDGFAYELFNLGGTDLLASRSAQNRSIRFTRARFWPLNFSRPIRMDAGSGGDPFFACDDNLLRVRPPTYLRK